MEDVYTLIEVVDCYEIGLFVSEVSMGGAGIVPAVPHRKPHRVSNDQRQVRI